jgi:hypothetical protein
LGPGWGREGDQEAQKGIKMWEMSQKKKNPTRINQITEIIK